MSSEKYEKVHRMQIHYLPKNKREFRPTLRNFFFGALFQSPKQEGWLSDHFYDEMFFRAYIGCVCFFDGFLFFWSCLFSDFSFMNALILLVSFSFFRLFLYTYTYATYTEKGQCAGT